jgi:hypothetical protein
MAGPPPPLKTSVRADERDDPPIGVTAATPSNGFSLPTGSLMSYVSSISTSLLGPYAMVFGIVWFVFGFAGFIMSFVCFGYTGNVGEKLLGLILAIALGPVYWFYYFVSSSYCKANPPAFF